MRMRSALCGTGGLLVLGIHSASSRPRPAGEVLAKDIEQRIPFGWLQPAVSRRIGISGVQVSNQLGVFLQDDPQDEAGERDHAALLELTSDISTAILLLL